MSNTKCNLFVVGRAGVGKTFLIGALREFKYSHLETTSVFSKTDWVINTHYGQVEVEIKEKQRFDKSAIEFIRKNESSKSFILYVTPVSASAQKENPVFVLEDREILIQLATEATVMIAFVGRYNEVSTNLSLSQVKKELPFVEFFFPISPVIRGYESLYDFSFALRQIIVSNTPNQLDLATSLIKKNLTHKEKTLDLGNCNLTSLSQVKELFKNTHLETLILSNEWGEYSKGKYVRSVSVNEEAPNILFSLHKEITKLKQLKVLICGGNWKGKKTSIAPVKWHISDISVLTELPNLTVINASNNDIETVGAIGKLENLNKPYLNNNNIKYFPDIGNLKNLAEIYLSNNKLSRVDFLEKLSTIKTIDLHSNLIQDLSPLKNLISKLNIKDSKWEFNSISVLRNPLTVPPMEVVSKGKKSVLAYFQQLEAEKKIKLRPFKNFDIKLILVGNSNVGKSTLMYWLKTKKIDKKIATTHWLKFEQWLATANRKTFNIRVFDFGGQEYYHDTHYIFFTNRTAYVVLWEADTNWFDEIEVDQRQEDGKSSRVKIQTFPLAYWLDSIKYHTQRRKRSQSEKSIEKLLDERDASIAKSIKEGEDWTKHIMATTEKTEPEIASEENILVVQNKIDARKDKIFLDENSFKASYPKIFDFCEISVYKKKGLESFQTLLFEIFDDLEVVKQEYLGTWGYIKQSIEGAKFSNHFTLTEFKEYCNNTILQMPELTRKDKKQIQSVLFSEQDAEVFAEFLSDIGVCLYYPDNNILKNKIFLNQEQILDNIYKALHGLDTPNGEFTESRITEALGKSRALIKVMVECLHPEPNKTIADPACGTGGFFLAAYDFIEKNYELDRAQKQFLKFKTFSGNEIVANTRRLCLMNLFLHGIGDIETEHTMISSNDSLVADDGKRYDYVLTNPPFGKKSSMTFTNEEGEQEKEELTYNRQDFWATTSNKQLNFVQHIRTMLKTTGKAAVVVPDNVLFEGGAGETVRKKLLETVDLHTILRLPTGIFYAQGVKANVIFFDAQPASKEPWTKEIWYYDYRTNIHHTLKKNPLKVEDLKKFIECYNPSNRHKRKETYNPSAPLGAEGRWRKFTYDEIINRDKTSLDISWIKDKSLADLDNLPDPDELAEEIVENLEAGLESFKAIVAELRNK